MLKVLINAYACAPRKGSEPGMAWNWIVQLSKHCRLHVITEGEWQQEIEEALLNLPQGKNIKFYYNPVSAQIREICWNQGDWRFYYYYRKWQKGTLQIAKDIISKNKIDLIHQLNMVGYREPGLLWQIPDIPKVWGPVGGFGEIPNNYLGLFAKSSAYKQRIKQLINRYQVKLPYIKQPIKEVDRVVACNSDAKYVLQKYVSYPIQVISEVGAKVPENTVVTKRKDTNTLKIAWVGKNDSRKALSLALTVMQNIHSSNIQLHIYGVAKSAIENTAESVRDNVIFHGWLPLNQVHEALSQSDILLFTSLHEASGTAVLEALSFGLPVICHDTCGMADSINESCGLKIEMISVEHSIKQFSNVIEELNKSRVKLHELSKGALNQANKLSWENNAKKMIDIYNSVLANQ
ncbi:MAG: glycosyltransferase family 4 protein [Draconibacterium sp.]